MQNLPLQLMAAIRHSIYIKCLRKFNASYSNSAEKSCPSGTRIWSVRNCWISPTRNKEKNEIHVLCACRHTVHHQAFQLCTIQISSCDTISQCSHNRWTREKPEENQFKLQEKCWFKSPLCGFGGTLMKIKGFFKKITILHSVPRVCRHQISHRNYKIK